MKLKTSSPRTKAGEDEQVVSSASMSGISTAFLKVDGVQIDVEHLCYSVQVGNKKTDVKNILNDVSFRLRPGSMCALMGPSGSGKSTLLDLLADRKLYGQWSGEIYFNLGPRSRFFNRDSAYILQDDLHYATLTVRETIYFATCFKLPEGTSQEKINERVDELLKMMGLSHVQDSLVGDQTHKGISGGQAKRLSIAAEIVSLPDLIFLDEPTSGLDSTMALEVMKAVHQLAGQNRTCIATIHQPSPEVFELFDKLVLLCKGKLVYYGPSHLCVKFFTSPELGYFFEEGGNPAEFIIDVAEGTIHPEERTKPYTTDELEQAYLKSKYRYNPPSQEKLKKAAEQMKQTPEDIAGRHATRSITQFKLLTERNVLAITRDIPEITAQLAKNIIVGFLIGVIFYQQAHTTTPLFNAEGVPYAEVQNISSLLFFGTMFTMMSNIQAVPYLCSRNLIFRREVASNAYSVAPYWLSHCLTVIPLQIVGYTLYSLITYFLCEFPNTWDYFWYFYFALFLSSMSSYYFAMFLAAATQNARLALTFFPLTFLFLSTFAGFAIAVNDVPSFWSWAPYVDFVRWSFQGLMTNQWGSYDDDDYSSQSVLSIYGMEGFNKYDSFWIGIMVTGIMMILAYIAMRPPRKSLEKITLEDIRISVANQLKAEQAVAETSNPLREKLISNENSAIDSAMPKLVKIHSDLESQHRERSINFDVDETGIQPLSGCYLTFRNISYSVDFKHPQTRKMTNLRVLKGVSGRVEPKEMCALMGASGAGKSTLLDILADRKTTGEVTGEIYINGRRSTKAMMRSSAYVMQDNAHIGVLTVQESLYFAAQLRLPQNMSEDLKTERIKNIMGILGLAGIANSVVGDEHQRGISGGQKKRLSIGVEIIHLPELIFLDEPTTGLDSSIAYEVMYTVRKLANQNRTIVCTIHQPSSHTFSLFDTVMLLVAGQMFFYGKREKIVPFFTNCVYHFPYRTGSNIADFIIAISAQALLSADNQKVTPEQLVELYQQSSFYHTFYDKIEEYLTRDCLIPVNEKAAFHVTNLSLSRDRMLHVSDELKEQFNEEFFQIRVLVHRLIVRKRRDWKTTLLVTIRYVIVAAFYGSIFYQLPGGTDPTVYNNRLSILYFSLMALLMSHQEEVPSIHEDRLVFYRERAANVYSISSYWLSRLLIAIPIDIFNVFIFAVTLYYLTGLRNGAFGFFLLICWLTDFISLFICQFLAYISPSTDIAMSLFPVVLFFANSFEGFIVYLPQFPDWLSWGADLSYMRFSFQALVLNEFQGNESELPLESTYIDMLGFDTLSKTQCACFLILFLFFHGLMSFLAVRFINFEKR